MSKNTLRPYQVDAINELRQAILKGHRSVVLMCSTGSGKTTIASEMIRKANEKGKKCLFLADRIELVEQTSKRLDYEGIEHGIIMGNHERYKPHAINQVCSPQTLARRPIPNADLVIIDECHVAYGIHKKMMQGMPNTVFIGLSATPFTKGLGKMYSNLVIGATTSKLTDEGYLVPVKVFAPSKPDLTKIRTIAGDYDEKELFARVNKPKLVADIVDTWIKRGENRPTIGFAVNVLHSQHLCELFKDRGIRAAHIDAYMPKSQREQTVKDFKDGYIKVLFNVGILDKGFDYPEASCLIMARPTKSLMLYIQQAGRVLRTHASKEDAIILDHAGNTQTHGFVTDELPQELDDGTKRKVEASKNEKKEKTSICTSCAYVKKRHEYKCPCCGFVPQKKDAGVDVAQGELLEVTKKKITAQDKQKLYSELLYIETSKGYKRGFAANMYRNKYGVWPKGLSDIPMEPSPDTMNYIKSRMIQFSHKRKTA
jgi:superfamily II DNA or RNA helicase